jgi:hypothetical protein
MPKQLALIQYRDFSKGTIRTVQPSLAPKNSYQLGLNLDSDKIIGALLSRLGTDRLGVQMVAGKPCLGLHQHFETAGTVLFGVFSDGTNNDIYLASSGAKSLQDDTKDLKTRFLTYLGATVRVNGTDACKSYTVGGGWIATAGAFDLANMPKFKVLLEWKDRVYGAGVKNGILQYSSIADSTTKTISWTATGSTGAGQIEVEQEDNGGDIVALAKVPGYILIFKNRTMKRWDGASTYPEDLIKQGVYSQDCVCTAKEMALFINTKGVWATNGGYPIRISKPIQDFIDNIPGANWGNVYCWADDEYGYFSIGDITIGLDTFINVVLKYNIATESWEVRSYGNTFRIFSQYVDSNGISQIAVGDIDGQILQLNTGYTDFAANPLPITYSLESQDLELGQRALKKNVSVVHLLTENIANGIVLIRNNSNDPKEWKSFGPIQDPITQIIDFKMEGNWFNLKITGTSDSGQVKILGWEFPEKSITIYDTVK